MVVENGVWPIRTRPGRRVAIVFIHGYSGVLTKTWGDFPAFIQADRRLDDWDLISIGYATSLLPDLFYFWSRQPPIALLSDLLRAHLTHGLLAPYKRIALLAHSMGGLVVQRALLDEAAIAERVDCLVLYGTPSNGLRRARAFKFWNRQVADLRDDSDFMRDLRKRRASVFADPPFTFATVAGDTDDFVPPVSSLDPFDRRFHHVVPGNHLEIVKPTSPSHLGLLVAISIIVGDGGAAGPWSAARLAIERGEFREAAQQLEPYADELDPHALVQLALALEELGRREEALDLLEQHMDEHTDVMGVLAGRLKRRWLHKHRQQDAIKARTLYADGYRRAAAAGDHPQAFYLAINVAFMTIAMDPAAPGALRDARVWAERALVHTKSSPSDLWRAATMGEAQLILGDPEGALSNYSAAIALGPAPRQLSSMFQQAYHVADILYPPKADGSDPMADRLDALFRRDNRAMPGDRSR